MPPNVRQKTFGGISTYALFSSLWVGLIEIRCARLSALSRGLVLISYLCTNKWIIVSIFIEKYDNYEV